MNAAVVLDVLLGSSALLALIGLSAVAVKLVSESRKGMEVQTVVQAQSPLVEAVVQTRSPLVEQALIQMVSIGLQAQDAEVQAQNAMEAGSPQTQHAALGNLSVLMSNVQELTRTAVVDLTNIIPDTVDRMIDAAQ